MTHETTVRRGPVGATDGLRGGERGLSGWRWLHPIAVTDADLSDQSADDAAHDTTDDAAHESADQSSDESADQSAGSAADTPHTAAWPTADDATSAAAD